MGRSQGRLAMLALAALLPLAAASPATAQQPAAPLLLIMDSSGSMNETGPDGRPLIDAAKDALRAVVTDLPDGALVGLRVYGHRVPNTDRANGCQDTELIVPVAPLDRQRLNAAIDAYDAVGFTPIGLSLQQGAADLPPEGNRTIVLVSDGIDTCAPPDPCQVARDLIGSGVELRVETVGFLADDAARAQLRCIAEATGGTYTDASNAAELAEGLVEISSRAARSTQLAGTPVEGAVVPDEAPLIQPGSYTDTSVPGEILYYGINLREGDRAHVEMTIQEAAGVVRCGDAMGVAFADREYRPSAGRDFTICAGREPEVLVSDYEVTRPFYEEDPADGTYYVVVDRSDAVDGPQLAFEFTVDVERAPPLPSPSASASPSASPTPSPTPEQRTTAPPSPVPIEPESDEGSGGAVTAGVAGLLGALLGGGLVFAALRGRSAGPAPGGR